MELAASTGVGLQDANAGRCLLKPLENYIALKPRRQRQNKRLAVKRARQQWPALWHLPPACGIDVSEIPSSPPCASSQNVPMPDATF